MSSLAIPPVWVHPSTGVVAAPTFSGKTVWVKTFLQSGVVEPDVIIWFYSVSQPLYEEMLATCPFKIVFHQGLPEGDLFEYLDTVGYRKKIYCP
jgi:hypothetical protein